MFFYSELVEISNIILTSFILFILLYFSYWILFIIITFLFQLYYWFKVKNKELSQIYSITEYMILYIYIYIFEWFFFFFWTLIYMYDFRQYDYVLTLISSQWGLFIGTETNSIWGHHGPIIFLDSANGGYTLTQN